jgi:hypothetical protein
MRQCTLYCVDTEKDVTADVLEETDRRLKVAIVGTDITIVLSRTDIRYPYIGHAHNMEFETFGELE